MTEKIETLNNQLRNQINENSQLRSQCDTLKSSLELQINTLKNEKVNADR
jgi:regulator of replication initiation timing